MREHRRHVNQRFVLPVCSTSLTAVFAWQCGQGGEPSDGARAATIGPHLRNGLRQELAVVGGRPL